VKERRYFGSEAIWIDPFTVSLYAGDFTQYVILGNAIFAAELGVPFEDILTRMHIGVWNIFNSNQAMRNKIAIHSI
jgi:hypothetical protein